MPSILDFNSLITKLNHFYKKPLNFVGRKEIVNLRDRPVQEQWDINKQRKKIQTLYTNVIIRAHVKENLHFTRQEKSLTTSDSFVR